MTAEAGLRAAVEALIGGPTPPIFLSDRPNKIIRVAHRNDRLGATVTESMVRVHDIVAALAAAPPQPDQAVTATVEAVLDEVERGIRALAPIATKSRYLDVVARVRAAAVADALGTAGGEG